MSYSASGYILAMDTAGDYGSIAILKGKESLLELSWRSDAPHSRTLLSVLDKAMGLLGLTLNDMGLIAVNRGPGRWTGIRLGISTAMGLSMALGIPVKGIAGLDAMAQWAALSCCMPGDMIFPVLDARRSQIYTAVYSVKAGDGAGIERMAVREAEYAVMAPDAFGDLASREVVLNGAHCRTGRIVLLGDGIEKVSSVLDSLASKHETVVCAPPGAFLPGATAIGLAAFQSVKSSGVIQTDCKPLYIRPSDAEANKKLQC